MTVLHKNGAHVTHVDSGRKVLTALGRNSFDLVLMDVEMPGLNGLEATRRIRGGQSGHDAMNIPVIAMTARSMSGDREECLAAGMNVCVTKPLSFMDFLNVLGEFL
jgi:CheY-like chemotaxis protein